MKNNTLTNKKLVSALMIGISAMITLQSPVTAYASGPSEELPDNTGPEPNTETQAESVDTYEPVTSEAQSQAETAQEAISGSQEQAPSAEGQQEADVVADGAAKDAQEAANLILSGNEEAGIPAASVPEDGTKAGGEIGKLVEAAEAIVNDGHQEDGSIAPSAVSDFTEAATKVAEVKDDLSQAETANKEAEASYTQVQEESKEITDSASEMIKAADGMKQDTEDADTKATELVEKVQNATNEEDAQKAYNDLEKLVSDMESDLAAKKALYDRMVSDYEKAVEKLNQAQAALDAAEERFDGKVSDAVQGTITAQASVAEAQRKVDNLAEALDKVEDKLSDENEANNLAKLRGNKEWEGKLGGIDKNRVIMHEVVANYYIPQVLGLDIILDEVDYARDFKPVSGAEGQEYNYHEFTFKYRDKDGNIQEATKYFNWDSLTKLNLSALNLNNTAGVVVFEKTEDEIAADKKVKEYYKGQSILNNNNKKNAYNQGKFDVFVYTDDTGQKNYLIRDEIENPQDASKLSYAEDGTPLSYDGHELKMVVQNQNNLLHDGNCLIVASEKNIVKYTTQNTDVRNKVIWNNGVQRLSDEKVNSIIENSRALNNFIAQNSVAKNPNTAELMSKYAQYKEATLEAKAAAAAATDEVDKLADAIDTIKEQSRNKKSRMAVDVLGVSDIAAHLGITVSAEEATRLNGMTMSELVNELNGLKAQADEKAAAAQEKAKEIQARFDNAAGVLENTIARLNPGSSGGGAIEDGGTGNLPGGSGGGGAAEASAAVRPGGIIATISGGVALENDAAGGTSGVALENNASGGTNGVALENNAAGAGFGNVVEIGEEEVALSDGITDPSVEIDSRPTLTAQQNVVKANTENVVTIEEEQTALSATIESGTLPIKKNWFWLIVIAVLGSTGEMLYKRHMEKKEEKLRKEDDEWGD